MRTQRRTNLLWGVVLLALALVLLLQALELIPAGIYDLLVRAWPALLVLAGLSIFLRPRVTFGSGLALIASVALVAGVSVVAFSARATEQRSEYIEPVNQPIAANISLLRLRGTTRNTDIEIIPALSQERVVTGEFTGSTESNLQVVYLEEGASATLSLIEEQASQFPLLENVGRGTLRLEVPPGIPLDIELNSESGDVLLNTSTLAVERMNLNLQQGDALVTLPVYQPLLSEADDNLGTLAAQNGAMTVFIPPEVAARLELNRGGSGIEPVYDAGVYNFLVGDVLEARNIESAAIRVRYSVTAPRGPIRVEVPN